MAEQTVTAAWLSEKTSYTERQLRNIAKQGYFPSPIDGNYQATPAIMGSLKYLSEQVRKRSDTLRKEQEALTKAKRELAEEELAKFRGEYVPKSVIGPALRNVSLHQRAVLQRKLEQEIAPNLAGLTTIEILAKMKAAVDELCAIFREGTRSWMDAPP